MACRKRSMSNEADTQTLYKEWDEASCPICMDHPHNAVLLLCSSHDQGCRSYICDTSYRHSNCFDRFNKLRAENRNNAPLPNSSLNNGSNLLNEGENVLGNLEVQTGGLSETRDFEISSGRSNIQESNEESSPQSKMNLRCPLCRGTVLGWKVEEEARRYLDLKPRSCSCESCSFFGNYRELRRHARRVHPTARPSNTDPLRQQAWRSLEHQREYADIVSAIRSAMPGAVVFGDYVVENGDRVPIPNERERGSGDDNGPWWTTFFLFEMIGSVESGTELRARSRAWSGHRRSTGTSSRRRYLWGENLLGLQDDDDDDDDDEDDSFANVLSDTGEDPSPIPRRRRRLTRSISDEDQS